MKVMVEVVFILLIYVVVGFFKCYEGVDIFDEGIYFNFFSLKDEGELWCV